MKRCHIDNWRVKETRCYWQQSGCLSTELYLFQLLTENIFLSLNCPAYTSLPAWINHWLLNEMSIKAEGYYHTGLQASVRVMPEAAAQRLKWGEVRPSCRFVCSHRLWGRSSFFFLKDRNRLKFPWLDRHQHVGWGNSGVHTHTPSKNKQHLHLRTCTFTCTLLYSHTGIYLQPHSCTVTFFPLVSSHSVPSCDSLTPACNPICPDLCHSVSFTHSVF